MNIEHEYDTINIQESADILNVEQTYMFKLLDGNQIPFLKIDDCYRIKLKDLFAYKKDRDANRVKLLTEMARTDQKLGLI